MTRKPQSSPKDIEPPILLRIKDAVVRFTPLWTIVRFMSLRGSRLLPSTDGYTPCEAYGCKRAVNIRTQKV
jgi:hypothetical protein